MHLTEEASLLTMFNTPPQKVQIPTCPPSDSKCPRTSSKWGWMTMPWHIGPYTTMCSSTERTTETTMQTSTCFNVAQKEGLVFNRKKCAIKQESMTFFGGVFSKEGYSPRSGKRSKASLRWHHPRWSRSLQLFLGAVNYLQTFIPSPQLEHWAPPGSPQKGELLCLRWELQHVLPENKVPTAESPPQTPWDTMIGTKTGHPPVWCLTQGG